MSCNIDERINERKEERKGNIKKAIKVEKFGFWDGEKVVLEDKYKTTVRKLAWLNKVKKIK